MVVPVVAVVVAGPGSTPALWRMAPRAVTPVLVVLVVPAVTPGTVRRRRLVASVAWVAMRGPPVRVRPAPRVRRGRRRPGMAVVVGWAVWAVPALMVVSVVPGAPVPVAGLMARTV